jgi:putative oxidoreductase
VADNPSQSKSFPVRAYEGFIWLASYLQPVVLLAMRLLVGIGFFLTGSGKLMHLDKITDYFAGLGIPAPHLNAIMAGSTECFGGLLLALGLGARVVSIPLAFTMIVAYATADRDSLQYLFTDPGKFMGSDPFPFFITCLVVLAFGPGVCSIDGLIKFLRCPKDEPRGFPVGPARV